MTKEKQKSDKEPKKKRGKGPLMVGGALAAAAMGYLALAPKIDKTKAEKDATRAKITQAVPAIGIKTKAAEKIYREEKENITLNDIMKDSKLAVRLMRKGDDFSAKVIIDKVNNRYRDVRYNHEDKDFDEILREFDITKDEYETASNAVSINEAKEEMEAANEPDQLDWEYAGRVYRGGPIRELWLALYRQAKNGRPFDPLFLQLIGMNEQQLMDFAAEILAARQLQNLPSGDDEEKRFYENGIALIKKAYGLQ